MRKKRDEKSRVRWLRDFLCGILIGAGSHFTGRLRRRTGGGVRYLPSLYGSTDHPRTAIPKYWRWFPALAIGWCVGFLGFAKGIAVCLDQSAAITTWLFIGLIVGTVPSLFREAGQEGRGPSAWVSLAVCAAAVFAGLFYVGRVLSVTVEPSFWWYNFCGALWGMSVVIPGLTSSSVMMALGLYQHAGGLARLDLLVLSACLPAW